MIQISAVSKRTTTRRVVPHTNAGATKRTQRKPSAASARSAKAHESWQDPDVAARRSQKDHVTVAGVGEFRSVKQAFEELDLPMSQHGRFRLELKEKEKATFKDAIGHTFRFRIKKH